MFYQDLGEHAGALVTLVGLFAGISGLLLWRLLMRLEKKLDELYQLCCNCRGELPERFICRLEHEAEHLIIWEALHHHEHDFRRWSRG